MLSALRKGGRRLPSRRVAIDQRIPVWESRPARTLRRGSFWIPGEKVQRGGKHYQHGAMFVSWAAPEHVRQRHPVVLVHGGAVQGTEWTDTPDGRAGWADGLLDHGFAVFVVDRPTQGRSPLHPDVDGALGPAFSYEEAQTVFFPDAASGQHTQWPIPADDDGMLDAYVAAYGPLPQDIAMWQRLDTARLAALLDRIGPAVVVTHSASGSDGWLLADARPGLVTAIVSVEPMGPPFGTTPGIGTLSWGLTAAPLTYEPPRADPADVRAADPDALAVPSLRGLPVAVVASETSAQAQYAPEMVAFLRRAGADAELIDLPALGIHGNGHGLIYETNSDEALRPVLAWLDARTGTEEQA